MDRKVDGVHLQNVQLSSKLADMDKRLNEVKTLERDLTDNLRYRTAVANIEKLQEEIHELQGQIQQWDNSSYERQLENLQNCQAELIDKVRQMGRCRLYLKVSWLMTNCFIYREAVFKENSARCRIKSNVMTMISRQNTKTLTSFIARISLVSR